MQPLERRSVCNQWWGFCKYWQQQ